MKVPVNALRAGLVFSKPVYIDTDNFLIPAGIELREKDIEQLRFWNIDEVETDGDILREPAAEVPNPGEAVPEEQPQEALMGRILPEDQKIALVFQNYKKFIKRIDDVFAGISSGAVPDARAITGMTDDLFQTIRKNRITTIGFILGSKPAGCNLAKSSINTAILSALISEKFGYLEQDMRQLITGALLHDVGMLKLPQEILTKREQLSPQEIRQIQGHPLHSYLVVCRELGFSEDVGRIVLQHHERWDGEGYPRRLRKKEIALDARIVSAADAFEAMVSEKPYRNSMIGYQAMKNILSDNSRRFDPEVLKSFIGIMGIYPIGSIICLNSGAVARVIGVREDVPLRPKIRLIIDEQGTAIQPEEQKVIDLLHEKSLFILKALDPKDFAKKNMNKGRAGENRAAAEVEAAGMRIIARNVRSPSGEVDLIALDKDTLVFIEVKAWSVYGIDNLPYGISQKKQRRIIETAKYFLSLHREYNGMAVRFDVIFIEPEKVTRLESAFTECL
ncbi:MAG: YraN family protein [Treponema sp.]|jgi:uncharacterized protein (TIGR00252 family)|nr:YraN family protein [Treponema sp.]